MERWIGVLGICVLRASGQPLHFESGFVVLLRRICCIGSMGAMLPFDSAQHMGQCCIA